ncbi:MAG: zinc-binding dehydrogenase [Fidelibacterota bacterium]
MKQIWIPRHGAPDVLELRETTDPEPGKGQLRITVHFSGINFADILARMGLYPDSPKIPCVVGYEVSGIVEAIGEGVDTRWLGVRVAALTRFEGYSSKVCVPKDQIMIVPDGISLESAAALPVNYLTAYIMMVKQAAFSDGDTLLIHGIGGGVGIAALQLAKIIRAKIIIGTASSWKHDALRKMGADHLIDYNHEDFVESTLEITNGKGVDLVLDPVGGKNVKRSYECLRPLGNMVLFGISSAAPGKRRNLFAGLSALLSTSKFHPIRLINDNKGVIGCNLGHLWSERERLGEAMVQLVTWLGDGKIAPEVDKVFSFEEASEAHSYIQDHRNLGKVLLTPL